MSNTKKRTHARLRTITRAQWIEEGKRLFGPDLLAWAFTCPICGHEATVAELHAAGASSGQMGFCCIGRFKEGVGCDYTLGGLFRSASTQVIDLDAGTSHLIFEFTGDGERESHNAEALLAFERLSCPVDPAEAPEDWADFAWPDWVPAVVRDQIVAFWSCAGRGPEQYLRDCIQQRSPRFGGRFRAERWGRKGVFVEGRWVHAWNNIGRLVTDNGEYACASFPGLEPVEEPTSCCSGAYV